MPWRGKRFPPPRIYRYFGVNNPRLDNNDPEVGSGPRQKCGRPPGVPPTLVFVSGRRCGISKNAILSDSTGCRHPRARSWRQPSATPHAASFVLNKPDDGVISLSLSPFVGACGAGRGIHVLPISNVIKYLIRRFSAFSLSRLFRERSSGISRISTRQDADLPKTLAIPT